MAIPKIKTDDLLSVTDLSRDEITAIFEFSAKLKSMLKKGRPHRYLKNQTLAMIFEKSSTRTRVSFETGIYQLGGNGIFLSGNDIQLGRGETMADTARTLSRYVDGIMIRTFSQKMVEELAVNATVPVINGLTDMHHPCQALTDYFTIYERRKDLARVKMAYIGDGNNMAHSLILTAAILGSHIAVATPKKYAPDNHVIEEAYKISAASGAKIHITTDIKDAAKDADYIYTDVWASMGMEKEAEKRKKDFAKYTVSHELIKVASPHVKLLHCLPAHRGEEIQADVMDSDYSIIFDQAENRLHVQKAIMCALMGK